MSRTKVNWRRIQAALVGVRRCKRRLDEIRVSVAGQVAAGGPGRGTRGRRQSRPALHDRVAREGREGLEAKQACIT